MKKILSTLAVIGALALSPVSAMAEDTVKPLPQYSFDKAHTQILFFVNHLGFSNSQGEFLDYDGGFTFDPERVEQSQVNVTIKTASIDMDDEKWDAHLKNADFFDVENHPTMTFKSTKIIKVTDTTGLLKGDLTLLGQTQPVTLNVDWNKTGTHPYSGKIISGFSAVGTLNRSDFGMTYGLPGVSDEVRLMIEVEGVQQTTTAKAETE